MAFRMIRSFSMALESVGQRLMVQPQLQLCGMQSSATVPSLLDDLSVWFAVPKQKISRSKKRMKSYQKRVIRPKENISLCPQTGQVTLKHRLPFNWRDFIPEFEYDADKAAAAAAKEPKA
mmetsp:Transcript_25149/g.41737  ORF Transcript_25149/g.41737 Transcript_25149/m.41737 type:complete len:120 (-) Transcript_25149:189-548(-)